jgi:hypothetical protein
MKSAAIAQAEKLMAIKRSTPRHRPFKTVPQIKVCIICAKPVPANDEAWMPMIGPEGPAKPLAMFKVHTECRKVRPYA